MSYRAVFAFALTLSAGAARAEQPAPSPMKCETGPLYRQFGGTDWTVYSCDDEHSMVVISRAGNPASPFYFILTPKSGAYAIHGEGNGSRMASDAAGDDLSRLTQADFAKMLAETKAVPAVRR